MGTSRTLCIWCFLLLAFWGLAVSAWADSGLGRHKKLYVVPAPGKVTIDGKLDDWDLSGQVLMYVTSETSDMQSAKFAAMYDADALYLSALVRDPSPLMNRHDPKVDGNKGWDADSCQFRLTLDPQMGYPIRIGSGLGEMDNRNVTHLILWHYTDTQEACLQMHASMNYQVPRPDWGLFGVVPQKLYQGKYVKMADGRGYTFEYRIPWSTLGAKAPLKAGDLVAGTVQFNWGTPDGLHIVPAGWAYDVMAGPGFPFVETGCWGKMLFSPQGKLPKEMVEEGVPPEKPLPLKFSYKLPEDSQITIQLMDKDNIVRRILVPQGDRRAGTNVELWDGMDDQGKLLPAGTYTWKGIYHQPITQKVLFSPHNSGNPPYKTDDGKGAWGGDHGTPQDACAFDDGMILSWDAAETGYGIIRTDLQGKKQWGTMNCATYLATDGRRIFTAGDNGFNRHVGVRALDIANSRPLNFGNGQPYLMPPPGESGANNEVSGVSYADGVVYVSFQGRNLIGYYDATSGELKGTWTVPTPGRTAPRPEGGLAVISGAKIVAVKDGVVTPLCAEHLDTPQGIAVGADGTIYVASAGALQNVSVFDKAGTYLRSIGKAGGRPQVGRYDGSGMLEPGGIALDKDDHLWVAERLDSPKRVSEWGAKTGALVNEFFGSSSYFGYSYIDPKKPDEIYCHNTLWKIDWLNNTCSPYATTWRPTSPNMMWAPEPGGNIGRPKYITAKNGKQYCFANNDAMSILSVRDGDVYKPFAATIMLMRWNKYWRKTTQFPLMSDAAKYPDGTYFWQDANHDQTLQDDELVPLPDKQKFDFNLVDGDLGIYTAKGVIYPTRVEADGSARYDFNKVTDAPWVKNGASWLDPTDDGIYAGLSRQTAEGQLQWSYPYRGAWWDCLGLPRQTPGQLFGLTNFLGVAGDFTGMSSYFGPYHIVNKDGVYVCMLMRDSRDGKGLGPDITASETSTGQLVKLDNLPGTPGKSRYFLLAGASDARVTEIFGLDTVKPLPGGTLNFTEADMKRAADAQTEYAAQLARGKRLSIARGRGGLGTADPITVADDATRGFTLRAAYDAANLYLAFDVTSPSDLVNSQPDPKILFKGGNCLDIQLAADPKADPKRKTPTPGDVRILVTRKDGKPCVVIYRPKVKGFTGQPQILSSPTGKEAFDAIEVSEKIGVEYSKTAAGYAVVVTIPQDVVGLALQPGVQLKLDVGCLYGNTTGSAISARSYWMNNSFSANVTNDIPSESRLEPGEWGTAVVE